MTSSKAPNEHAYFLGEIIIHYLLHIALDSSHEEEIETTNKYLTPMHNAPAYLHTNKFYRSRTSHNILFLVIIAKLMKWKFTKLFA